LDSIDNSTAIFFRIVMRRCSLLEGKAIDLINHAEKLEFFGNQINQFTEGSEGKFLEIGSKLQKYLTTSGGITQKSTSITASISEDILKNGINELNWLLKEFNSYLSTSIQEIQNDKKELHKIQPHIEAIINELEGFSKIVKQLRMLGIATKIESARLGTEDQGFNALAENVDKLSSLISEKAGNISKKSIYLFSELSGTISNLAKLEKEQEEQSQIIIKNISLSLEAFKAKHDGRMQESEKISLNSESITSSINSIVMSIQFHDITRQQMDHVRLACNENAHLLKSVSQNSESDSSSELGIVYDVCKLQSIQLRNSLDEFISAVSQIVENLSLVDEGVSQILSSASDMVINHETNDKCCLALVLQEVETIRLGLQRNREIGLSLAQSINSVVSVVDDLSQYVLEIEDVGSEIEIIALNARVKAARTGSNGSALGVLSERIQKLSLDAKVQTGTTSKILGEVSKESKLLRVNVDKGSYGDENQKLVEATLKISGLVKIMIDREQNASAMIDKLKNDVHSFKNNIDSTIESIQVHEEAKHSIDPIISGIEEIINDLGQHNIKSNKNTNTHALLGKYTMHSERKIHLGFTDGWNNKIGKNSNKENNSPESFGDNVELF
jgi:hypothetical protein